MIWLAAMKSPFRLFQSPRAARPNADSAARHEKDYMLRYDTQYREKFKDAALELADALNTAALASSDKIKLQQNLDAYQGDFTAYVDAAQLLASKQANTSAAFAKIEPGIGEIARSVAKLGSESLPRLTKCVAKPAARFERGRNVEFRQPVETAPCSSVSPLAHRQARKLGGAYILAFRDSSWSLTC
jgi:hypothetical protein